jgi:hypothetical protein
LQKKIFLYSTPISNLDSFDIGTKESLESLAKIELYHDGTGLGQGWNVEYVNIRDNTTEHSYCFPANKWISNTEHLILDDYVLDEPCEGVNKEQIESRIDSKDKQKRSFTVRTKTGRGFYKELFLWFVICWLRFSNRSWFNHTDLSPLL